MPEKELKKQLEQLHKWDSAKATQETFGVSSLQDLLDLFVKQHYLVREKDTRADHQKESVLEAGPRAFIEIGRKQLVSFSYEAAGMEVDPVAIQAIEEEQVEEGGGEEEEGAGDGGGEEEG